MRPICKAKDSRKGHKNRATRVTGRQSKAQDRAKATTKTTFHTPPSLAPKPYDYSNDGLAWEGRPGVFQTDGRHPTKDFPNWNVPTRF